MNRWIVVSLAAVLAGGVPSRIAAAQSPESQTMSNTTACGGREPCPPNPNIERRAPQLQLLPGRPAPIEKRGLVPPDRACIYQPTVNAGGWDCPWE